MKRDFVSDVHFVYGSTETHWLATLDESGTGHILTDVAIRVVNDRGIICRYGDIGMIEARTSVMIDGYLWDQPATDAAFRDGWYRTGDLGIMPENGRVIVVGCTDNMLNIGGVKIVPEPLETQIKALGGINDAVLIAVPGRRGVGELMVVFECAVSAVSQAIEKAVTDILSPVGRIFHVRTDPRLPVTATGKVRRDVLRDRLSHS